MSLGIIGPRTRQVTTEGGHERVNSDPPLRRVGELRGE